MICPIFWRYLFYQILWLNRINWLFLGFPHYCLTINFWTMHQLGFNQRGRPQRTSVCDYTEICYRDLALCDCGNWGSGFPEAAFFMSDSGAQVHRQDRLERKTDAKLTNTPQD